MKGDEHAPDYQGFYNDEALKLIDWMDAEVNTTKRAKLYRTACRLEYRFRKHRGIPVNGPWRTRNTVTLPCGLWMRDPEIMAQLKPPRGGTGAVRPKWREE